MIEEENLSFNDLAQNLITIAKVKELTKLLKDENCEFVFSALKSINSLLTYKYINKNSLNPTIENAKEMKNIILHDIKIINETFCFDCIKPLISNINYCYNLLFVAFSNNKAMNGKKIEVIKRDNGEVYNIEFDIYCCGEVLNIESLI
jgi:hypothetical protein